MGLLVDRAKTVVELRLSFSAQVRSRGTRPIPIGFCYGTRDLR
jgi:hypothetical protein